MEELLRRLGHRPVLFVELVIVSFFINLLALAPSLYVIQLFNRYLAHGIQGTLITLTVGVMIALVFEVSFRWLRQHIAAAVSAGPDHRLAGAAYGQMLRLNPGATGHLSVDARQELLRGVQKIQQAYAPANIITFMDLPFSLLILGVLYVLSPILSLIVALGLCAALGMGLTAQAMIRGPAGRLAHTGVTQGKLIHAAVHLTDLIRGFNGQARFRQHWERQWAGASQLRNRVVNQSAAMLNATTLVTSLMTIAVIGTGAVQVAEGRLTLGALIGANILAARALMPALKFIGLGAQLAESRQALKGLYDLAHLPGEGTGTTRMGELAGQLSLKDLAFVYPGATTPLFESLTLDIPPGQILAVVGYNGSGKTTLARILAGLLDPSRGQVLVDGVALSQLDLAWWRRQLIYLPQEPEFFAGTLGENIGINSPELSARDLHDILEQADIKRFVDTRPKGLDTGITQGGRELSLGIRRRLALARALGTGGQVVIFDEPTEGLDTQGQAAVYELLNTFARQGKTMILFSHDRHILKGAGMVVDLSQKPVPAITRAAPARKNQVN